MPFEVVIQLPDAISQNSYQDTVDMFQKIVQTIFVNKNKNIQLTLPLYKHKTRKIKHGIRFVLLQIESHHR